MEWSAPVISSPVVGSCSNLRMVRTFSASRWCCIELVMSILDCGKDKGCTIDNGEHLSTMLRGRSECVVS